MLKSKFVLLVLLIFTMKFSICEREDTKNFHSKDKLKKMFLTFTDDEINALDFDLVAEIKKSFSDIEREDLIVGRMTRFSSESAGRHTRKTFDAFRERFGTSFLNATEAQSKLFTEYIKNNYPMVVDTTKCP